MTYMFILKCALKLVEEIILYYDARSKKHKKNIKFSCMSFQCPAEVPYNDFFFGYSMSLILKNKWAPTPPNQLVHLHNICHIFAVSF